MPKTTSVASLVLSAASLGMWLLMFGAGTDVWHDTGRLDLWNLEGPPYFDLRVFIVMFYLLLPIMLTQSAISLIHVWMLRRGGKA